MIRYICAMIAVIPSLAFSQWSVYDEKIHEEIKKINEVSKITNGLDSSFKGSVSSSSSGQDVTLGTDSNSAILKGLDTKFEELTVDKPERYVGTEQDCGSNDQKFLKHYNACKGLRKFEVANVKAKSRYAKDAQQAA